MKTFAKRLTWILPLAGLGFHLVCSRMPGGLPSATQEEIQNFFHADSLSKGDLRLLAMVRRADSLHASLPDSFVTQNRAGLQSLFHKLLRHTLRTAGRGTPSSLQQPAEVLARAFITVDQDSFFLRELHFYEGLDESQRKEKITAEILYRKAQQYLYRRQYKEAEKWYQQSLLLCLRIKDVRREIDNLLKLQYINYVGGDHAEALRLAQEVVEKADRIGYRFRQIWGRNLLASSLFFHGAYREAAEQLEIALALARQQGSLRAQCELMERLGVARRRLGNYPEALEYGMQALKLAEQLGLNHIRVNCLIDIGLVYRARGEYMKAERYYRRAVELAHRQKQFDNEAVALTNIGFLYRVLGQYERAKESCLKALDIYIGRKDPQRVALVLKNLGDIYFDRGADSTALRYYSRALAEVTRHPARSTSGLNRLESELHVSLGDYYGRQGQWHRAVLEFEKAVQAFQRQGFKEGEFAATLRAGRAYLHLGNDNAALFRFRRALDMAANLEDPMHLPTAHFAMAQYYEKKGDRFAARKELVTAVETIESTRLRLAHESQMSYFATQQEIYDELIRLHLDAGEVQQAFEFVERSRARSLYEHLQRFRPAAQADSARFQTLPDLTEVQETLPADVAVLEYKILPNEVVIFAFDQTDVQVARQPIRMDSLRRQALNFLSVIGARDYAAFRARFRRRPQRTFEAGLTAGEKLYDLLVAPAHPLLQNRRLVYIVPDGILNYLPFAALTMPGDRPPSPRFWVEEAAIAYAPSAALMRAELQRPSPIGKAYRLLALANPAGDLRGAEDEARFLQRLFQNAVVLKTADVSETAFRNVFGPKYGFLHFATHAVVDNVNPWSSYLLLGRSTVAQSTLRSGGREQLEADDDVLTVQEILGFDFSHVQLVVLSACETAGGRFFRGEGVFGLTQAFLQRGAQSVLTSLWKIDDRYTRKLIKIFYRRWRGAGTDFAHALRDAQLSLIQDMRRDPLVKYPYPFAWGAFILVGNYR